MTIRCLSLHARYACRHTGACCTSGWPIPVEADRLTPLTAAVEDGRLVARSLARPLWIEPADAPVATPAQLQSDAHGCVFHERRDGGRCRIHQALGHSALPLACRQFPRVSVIDPRGASVTLSHFCPTAASLLEERGEIWVTSDAPAFPSDVEIVGLDVRASLPPLIRPDMLMDWDSWWAWERHAVDTIARPDRPPEHALATLSAAVASVRMWTPDDGPLLTAIEDAFRRAGTRGVERRGVLSDVLGAIPPELRPQQITRSDSPSTAAIRGFLAAHAFANWTPHLGQGLRSWLRSVEAAWSLVHEFGVRQSDLLLRHLADPNELARVWSRGETE
jgi:hypothetical protein